MIIPTYSFCYTMHGCIAVEASIVWVRFETDSRAPNPDQEYHCKCVSSNKIHTVFGRDILTPRVEYIKLVEKKDKKIPEDWSIGQIFQYLGVPITVT